jgi:hypothetical protein
MKTVSIKVIPVLQTALFVFLVLFVASMALSADNIIKASDLAAAGWQVTEYRLERIQKGNGNIPLIVKASDLYKQRLRVVGYQIEVIQTVCTNPEFAPGDKDHDGFLDRACNISYNPCEHDSIAKAYNDWQRSGAICVNQVRCNGITFSPPPPACVR